MKRTILSLLVVGLLAGVGTSAVAQNVKAGDQPNADAATNPQPADPAAGAATASQRDKEYQAALKKCESLTAADKTNCVDTAKKKSGQM
jgi:thioredoxin-like negative regulator of GroEL